MIIRYNKILVRLLALVFLIASPFIGNAQEVLTLDRYFEVVKEHHPISKQAGLQTQTGEAFVAKARGGFDPKLSSVIDQKYFDGKTYYKTMDNAFKVPTWFGVDLKGGFEQNSGQFLNPESTVPASGLWYAGISVPVGQGLFIDQRRADLRQAQLFLESTQAERQLILNDLFLNSVQAYWDWFFTYHQVLIFEEATELAMTRYRAVIQEFKAGDKPAIDTVEAGIQWQSRTYGLQQAQLDFANATAQLDVFLWQDGLVPLELTEDAIPPTLDAVELTRVELGESPQVDSIIANHPMMIQSQLKIDQLEIQNRLNLERLKPTLNLNYNALSEPMNGDVLAEYSINNYKWGMEFEMPIFLRKERSNVRLTNIKIQDADFELSLKRETLEYKAIAAINNWQTTIDQYQLYNQITVDYQRLLAGERSKFDIGESSLFLVNSREVKYIEARIKLIELLVKNQEARLKLKYALNQF